MAARGVLHTPLTIGGTTTVRNRLYRAPVLEGAGDGDDCADRYARHFVENARHGVGLVIQGNSCLYEEGRTSPGMTLVHTRERMLRLALAVGGIRTAAESDDIVDSGDADLVGMGRPFYAEADLAARILGGHLAPARCRNSNLCVPAQMLGMKGVCYNPEVKRATHGAGTGHVDGAARAEALDRGDGEG
jgi:2,4-dienoyl-CoA reductase-like NADH-dependent reductase (Old Yellow Enzyme family)